MKTKDFGLITTLKAKGHQFVDYYVDDLGRIFFRFDDCPEIKAIEDGFFRNTLSVRVQDFLNAQTMMKTLVFDIKRKANENGITVRSGRTTDSYHTA
ncbi:MAG: hypothetical protein KDB65_12120 [Calditrichaeota bacterium]|nr:hypothetical protein [Calditrichota bacterium]MCB9367559.1 hypothetical protein [Calditrichota bacterium]